MVIVLALIFIIIASASTNLIVNFIPKDFKTDADYQLTGSDDSSITEVFHVIDTNTSSCGQYKYLVITPKKFTRCFKAGDTILQYSGDIKNQDVSQFATKMVKDDPLLQTAVKAATIYHHIDKSKDGSGGGGGAGGVAVGTNIVFPGVGQLSIPITVGDGGPVSGNNDSRGNNGSDSRFGSAPESYSFVAHGGGYGGGDGSTSGGPGGSGGGGHYGNNGGNASQPGANPGKSWVTNYGYAGSNGHGAPQHNSGAGGGAGSVAVGGASNDRGAAGDGENFPIWDVTNYMPDSDPYWTSISPLPGTHYGGGGGGGDYPPYLPLRMPANATNGGGGIGGPTSGAGPGTQGVDGLGGGGGGACGDSPGPKGGKGGNGIVVIRYRT
mgnify:CR=1 FL=1